MAFLCSASNSGTALYFVRGCSCLFIQASSHGRSASWSLFAPMSSCSLFQGSALVLICSWVSSSFPPGEDGPQPVSLWGNGGSGPLSPSGEVGSAQFTCGEAGTSALFWGLALLFPFSRPQGVTPQPCYIPQSWSVTTVVQSPECRESFAGGDTVSEIVSTYLGTVSNFLRCFQMLGFSWVFHPFGTLQPEAGVETLVLPY